MSNAGMILTVGHSTRSLEAFIELLARYTVTAIADVRSVPYSQRQPQFNREPLRTALRAHQIAYVFLGKELGARSEDPNCYVNGRVQYRRLAATDNFRQGLARVIEGSSTEQVALLCAEGDPLDCHRTILVARELVTAGVSVAHIDKNGKIESHPDAMRRLLTQLHLLQHGFFDSPDDLADRAYAEQEARIAYVAPELAGQAASSDR